MKWYAILAACFIVGASGETLFELFSNLYYEKNINIKLVGKCIKFIIHSYGLFVLSVNWDF